MDVTQPSPIDPDVPLQPPVQDQHRANGEAESKDKPFIGDEGGQTTAYAEDSAVTKAEKYERRGSKRIKLELSPDPEVTTADSQSQRQPRVKGIAPIKAEYLVHQPQQESHVANDDAAEAHHKGDSRDRPKYKGGQNKSRKHKGARDELALCSSRANHSEFSPAVCQYGEECKFEHDLRKYLEQGKREDLKSEAFDTCPVFEAKGRCDAGWKCRFLSSHQTERETEDGRRELVLLERQGEEVAKDDTTNNASYENKVALQRRKFATPKADQYTTWLDEHTKVIERMNNRKQDEEENAAQYVEPPFLPSEKRKIYFGPETPVLAPLTTQGNLPFRRLCVSLGAQATYSEMAMSLPLIQGSKSEWALMRAHISETEPPAYSPKTIVNDYDNSKDFKIGAQIAATKPWHAIKATEIITSICPHLRVVDLNCGCPIDLVFKQGAGSALLDAQGKLEKMLRGMNAVSGSVPITVKIRTGTKDNRPTATKLIDRLVHGGADATDLGQGPCGVAAITLHGRSRQQRYTRSADWSYIAECAALISSYESSSADLADTSREPDPRSQPNGKVYFLGNGDCYSHTDYTTHLSEAKVDAVMIARGALIKPWIFEEISAGQYIDKSATERLALVEKFARNGLEVWGSDERGVGITRRFLLEWLSFAYRYVPVSLLEYLPPSLQDRPPAWRGRNELETLLGSGDYRDWIKIRYVFCLYFLLFSARGGDKVMDANDAVTVRCSLDQYTRTLDSSLNTRVTAMRSRLKDETTTHHTALYEIRTTIKMSYGMSNSSVHDDVPSSLKIPSSCKQ